jgi:alpha-D-xyloside xylohydrolase
VTSTWSGLKKQIAAGLAFSISGVPYWTTDTGGYTMERKFAVGGTGRNTPEEEDEWRELNARWFEFSTFCPLLRVHGELRPREMWTLGDNSPAYNAELKFDRLRYRLFPYLYSLAGAVRREGGTFMRPMVMDFPEDQGVRDLADEYMFGHEFLIAPVSQYKARLRPVVLPEAAGWYDFWLGRPVSSGAQMAKAPLDSPPVFVRAGSIIPLQPVGQYIGQDPAAPITLVVYAGANGSFTLYQDDGLTNAYEKGAFSEIPITWNDQRHEVTIGQRKGSFKGMPDKIHFQVIVVSPSHPWPYSETQNGQIIQYAGTALRRSPL